MSSPKIIFSFLYLLHLWFSNFIGDIGIPWGILPLTPPTPPHFRDPEAVGLGWRPVVCIFMGPYVAIPTESTTPSSAGLLPHQTRSLAVWSVEKKTKGLDRWRQGKQMTCASAGQAVPRDRWVRCAQAVPCQPSQAPPCWKVQRGQTLFVSPWLSAPLALFWQVCPGLAQQTASAAPAREEWLEEGGSEAVEEEGWGRLGFQRVSTNVPEACGLQEALLLPLEGGPGAPSRLCGSGWVSNTRWWRPWF